MYSEAEILYCAVFRILHIRALVYFDAYGTLYDDTTQMGM